jgi:hypothetical protein
MIAPDFRDVLQAQRRGDRNLSAARRRHSKDNQTPWA